MLLSDFAIYLQKLEDTASRLEMTAILAELFQSLEASEINAASFLLQGRLVPAYESLEFQLSEKMVSRALARIEHEKQLEKKLASDAGMNLFGEEDFSAAETVVKELLKKRGDIGLVAAEVCADGEATKKKPTESISEVYDALKKIAEESGEGSQERKINGLVVLLKKMDATSAKFITRIIVGEVRLGFSTMTMLDALSWAMTGDKSESSELEQAYQKKADIGKLAAAYLMHKDAAKRKDALEKYNVEIGVPIVPQLCQRLNSTQEMIDKMHEVYAEPKYDGLRVQIHIEKNTPDKKPHIKIFTRNLEDATHMFPEVEKLVPMLKADNVILDGEAIGYDPATGKLLPFQETITRKRKHDIAETSKNVPLRFFIFDVLEIDNQSLIFTPLRERKARLEKLFDENEQFRKTTFITTSSAQELQTFHEDKLSGGLEGMVVKQIDSPYQSGRKGWYWVKMKEAEGTRGKLSDTVDCVVMGYNHGKGQRAAFGAGTFLVGVRASDGNIKTISKVGSGLSEEMLKELKKLADENKVAVQPSEYEVKKEVMPDVWVAPQIVVEIAADELTKSPLHTAGVAFRFPRILRIRFDKQVSDATTTEEISQMTIA